LGKSSDRVLTNKAEWEMRSQFIGLDDLMGMAIDNLPALIYGNSK